jgi:hypothetical protein
MRRLISNEILIQKKIGDMKKVQFLNQKMDTGMTYEEWVATMEVMSVEEYKRRYKPLRKTTRRNASVVSRLLGGHLIYFENNLFVYHFHDGDETSEMWSESAKDILKAIWETEVKEKVE